MDPCPRQALNPPLIIVISVENTFVFLLYFVLRIHQLG